MRKYRSGMCALIVAAAGALCSFNNAAQAQLTAEDDWTFQGQLQNDGAPFDGTVGMTFRLFDKEDGGEQLGPTLNRPNVRVSNGFFGVDLDFGIDAIKAGGCWLDITVANASGEAIRLAPRKAIRPTPKALVAVCANGADGDFTFGGDDGQIVFGPDCSIGVDPDFTGIVERDPVGLRVLGRGDQGCRVLFGPTDDCTVEVNPTGPAGLTLRDPSCVRVLNPFQGPNKIVFGAKDDCNIGTRVNLGGLVASDPVGFRVLGPNNQGCRVLFGTTNNCAVEINPGGPAGLTLRDPNCVRVLNPFGGPNKINFGTTDLCSIGTIPELPGLVEQDPTGFRLLGRNNEGCRLIFGPTMDCTVEVQPDGPEGLLLRDPRGIRIVNPIDAATPILFFGQNNECFIEGSSFENPIDPLKLCDPNGFNFQGGPVAIGVQDRFGEFALQVGGAVAAEDFVQFSSGRFKTEVADIDNAIDLVERLRGVSFDWVNMNDGKHDIGFIAEEVAKVLPELVQMENGEAVGVAYHRLTAVTVEAIKAQQTQIKGLTSERDDLQARVERLEALVEALVENGGK